MKQGEAWLPFKPWRKAYAGTSANCLRCFKNAALRITASHQASGEKAAARILQGNSQEQEAEVISGANPS
ncbi:hypothetical protein [Dechloromonas hortensis]|uniref:hypothetical protein n=1 Tax=Dechloromonas hortensis TaxID=337779 RepID=UPI001292AD74|nr:hypothetical protein [Dechloromonas hortensis]